MKTRHIVLVACLVVAAFGVGWLIRKRPVEQERSEPERKPVAEASRAVEPDPPPPPVAPASLPVEEPVEEEPAEQETEEPKTGPVTDEEITRGIDSLAGALQALIVGAEEGKQTAARFRELLRRATDEQVEGIIGKFLDDATPLRRRILLAHALGQSELPQAIAALESALRDAEAGMMVHRFASHALAFSEADGIGTFIAQQARDNADIGVRANLAFGLQRRGDDEGVGLYFAAVDEAFETHDPSALQYVGGLSLIDERADPGIRERLISYENTQALLVLIAIVQKRNDVGAIPALEQLANDGTRPIDVRKSAQGALKALAKEKP